MKAFSFNTLQNITVNVGSLLSNHILVRPQKERFNVLSRSRRGSVLSSAPVPDDVEPDEEGPILSGPESGLPQARIRRLHQIPFLDVTLTSSMADRLRDDLPICERLAPIWVVGYMPGVHGVSLQTMYRQCLAFNGPSLVVIEDTQGNIFGGFASHRWVPCDRYYGNDDAFVFRSYKINGRHEVDIFHPVNGSNNYFQYASKNAFAMGGGQSAWHVGADLIHGSSYDCDTFCSPRFSDGPDFIVRRMEIWFFNFT